MTLSDQRVEDPHHYLVLAFEYYVAGRFAALTQLRIAANLLHHAIELLLKHALLQDVPQERLSHEAEKIKKRQGHDIDKLWARYKGSAGDPQLNRFDSIVTELNRWEDLRYGGFPTGLPTTMMFSPRRGEWRHKLRNPNDVYVLVLEDIDDVFAEILATSGINPKYLGVRFHSNTAIQDWYLRENQFAAVFDRPSLP